MYRSFFMLAFVLASFAIKAQTFREKYAQLNQPGNDSALFHHINDWLLAEPTSADPYIAFFNFYLDRSEHELIEVTKDTVGKTGLVISDSLNNPVGMLVSRIGYDDSLFALAIKWVNAGIEKHPKRLDLYFGKIYALGLKGDYLKQTSEVISVIQLDSAYQRQWLWDDDQPQGDTSLFREAIQDYASVLFGVEKYAQVKAIARAMIKHYPNDIYSITNMGACMLMDGKWDEALFWFKRAESLRPNDVVVMNNMAYTYEQKGDIPSAILYYQKMMEKGDEEQRSVAKQKLSELK